MAATTNVLLVLVMRMHDRCVQGVSVADRDWGVVVDGYVCVCVCLLLFLKFYFLNYCVRL